MKINLSVIACIAYISLSLDSLVKVDLGFKIHVGVLLMLAGNLLMLPRIKELMRFVRLDMRLLVCLIGLVLSAIISGGEGVKVILLYFIIAFNVALFTYLTAKSINYIVVYWFQVLLIITGLIQYLILKASGFQLSFIDAEHYMKGYSVANRLRGFFVEPNWYAIAITFNTILLIGKDIKVAYLNSKWILFLSFLVMILNGTLATLGVLLLTYLYPIFRDNIAKGIAVLVACLSIVVAALSYRESVSVTGELSFNHNSRLVPIERVLSYQADNSIVSTLFGFGLGTWGTEAVAENLSVLVYDEKPESRDGSELPVILYELGWVGIILILVDAVLLIRKAGNRRYYLGGGVVLFLVCLSFYPIYKFLMYMPYYFLIRYYILTEQEVELKK